MINFEYCSPTKFIFGKDTENTVGEQVKNYTKTGNILVVYSSERIAKSGLLDKVLGSLKENGIEAVTLTDIKPNPPVAKVREGIALARKNHADFILAIGGGSTIDCGKGIACGVLYDGDIADILAGEHEPEEALPLGVILTLSATGSEGSNCAVINNDENLKAGIVCEAIRPKFSIMNPELTCSVPAWHTAAGSCDILAHILESYFTGTKDVRLTDELIEGLVRTVIEYAPVALKQPDDYNARAQLMWSGMLANSGFFHVGRIADTAPHGLAECLGSELTHGATLSVILPAWMEYTCEQKPDRYIRFSEKVWGIDISGMSRKEAIHAGVKKTKEFFQKMGLPVTLQELGLDPDKAPSELAAGDFEGWTMIPGFEFVLDEEDRRKIYELATRK